MNEAVNEGNEKEGSIIDSKVVLLHRPTLGWGVAFEYSQVSVDGHGEIPEGISWKEPIGDKSNEF